MRLHEIEVVIWIVWLNMSASLSTTRIWQHDRVRASCLTTRSMTNQTKDDVCCACIADAANSCVAAHDPKEHRLYVCPRWFFFRLV